VGKVELRQEVKLILSKLTEVELREKSLSISNNLKQLISEHNSKTKIDGLVIGGYTPILKEPEWFLSFTEEDLFNYSIVHMHEKIKLSYHEVKLEEFLDRSHGLSLVKSKRAKEIIPDVLIIPGVSFTEEFERLGRGKGYFDSYLKSYKGIKIGIFYEFQKSEEVFSEAHDERLDFVITEKNIYRRG
jgi:5-formyltetrahydrofolate cyclo-ligase